MAEKTILVCGATGQQGGAVAHRLLRAGFGVRGITRNPDKPAAEELREAGVEVVEADLNDKASLERAVDGVWGVFSVQNFWETGYDMEVEQGRRMADVAFEAGIGHFVYSSVGSADRGTGIPHFDSKYEVEQHVRSLDMPYSILRPVWFMSNWEGEQFRGMILGGTLAQPLRPETTLQQIAVDDIGAFAVLAFQHSSAWTGREIEIAGDELTMRELADAFGRAIGREVQYHQIPWDDFREQAGEEYTHMYHWFEDVGYGADIEALRREHPGLQRFEEYLAVAGWKEVESEA